MRSDSTKSKRSARAQLRTRGDGESVSRIPNSKGIEGLTPATAGYIGGYIHVQ